MFIQASVAHESGRRTGPRPFDESRADLAQAYVDLPLGPVAVRVGRQELQLSGNRLLSLRDAAPLRRAFDGIKSEIHVGRALGTMFAVQPVLNRAGALDDRADPNEIFAGATLDLPSGDEDDKLNLFLFHRKVKRMPSATEDVRRTLGLRYQRNTPQWDVTSQLAIQSGRFGAVPVAAWSGSVEVGRTLQSDRPTRVAIQLGVASGDRSAADARIGTFDPLYPNLGVYSEAPIYYPANQINVGVKAARRWGPVNVTASTVLLARASNDDAIYSASGRPLVSTPGKERIHGVVAEVRAVVPIGNRAQFSAAVVHAEPFGVLERAGGRAATFGYVQLGRRF